MTTRVPALASIGQRFQPARVALVFCLTPQLAKDLKHQRKLQDGGDVVKHSRLLLLMYGRYDRSPW